jgi:hypothetical protein
VDGLGGSAADLAVGSAAAFQVQNTHLTDPAPGMGGVCERSEPIMSWTGACFAGTSTPLLQLNATSVTKALTHDATEEPPQKSRSACGTSTKGAACESGVTAAVGVGRGPPRARRCVGASADRVGKGD